MKYSNQNILVAIDFFHHNSPDILKTACDLAERIMATVHIIYVHFEELPSPAALAYWPDLHDEFVQPIEKQADRQEIKFLTNAFPIREENIHIYNSDSIAKKVNEIAKQIDAKLLVIGKHHSIFHSVGKIEKSIASEAHLDLLVVA